jgi:cyclic pyranopterin phosphate synthase
MLDGIGRNIDYLRISVTDKCNLRCQYCMPSEGVKLINHEELLTLEEITRVCRIMAGLGIRKIRLTGGEPLVRKNIVRLVSNIHEIPQIEDIAITTNGVLYAPMAQELAAAGLKRVNLSLDTMDPAIFAQITGKDEFAAVQKAMDVALENGMQLKINCVACRQLNENSLIQVAELARNYPVDVRFIELMPIGCGKKFEGIPSDEILAALEKAFGASREITTKRGNGPAAYRSFDGFMGGIGFISPMSHKFCSECNRIRLTAEGMLKLCLHYGRGVELKSFLRNENIDDAQIEKLILDAVKQKPESHHFENKNEKADKRKMYQIGG